MAIYRGIGGAGDSTTDATVTAVTQQATNAASSATSAASSVSSAATSATNAATSASSAATSASAASTDADDAAVSAAAALASETAAATSETNAATSETNAATSETNAATSASNASTSETNAATSASAAATSASNAATSETNAASSASSAATSATNAATSETNAATSETNAATSATNAATSETNAGLSATAAATSETNAATSETNAATSETNAATSATNAATSETNAATSASAASTSATNAATSETNAASSASAAATSATNAANSATAAQTAQTAAETAQAAAEAAQEAIDGSYLGAQTSDPTLDLNGDPVTAGDWYYNTTTDVTRIYDGSAWNNGAVSTAGFLLAGNNLSDLGDAATARTNLGLGTAATTDSTAYATAAQGTNADTAYGWGNHASAGYLTSYTETDPVVGAVNGLVKANGSGTISAAVAGTDYVIPSGSITGNASTATNATNATNITGTGTSSVPTSALASGTANSGTYLRGDRTWAAVGGGVTSLNGQTGAITNTSLYAIGSYVLGRVLSETTNYAANNTLAGSSLYNAGAGVLRNSTHWYRALNNTINSPASPTTVGVGTWRCTTPTHGHIGSYTGGGSGLWVRIS